MASDTVYSAVREYLEANWSATTIKWENETFDLPTPTDYPAAPAAFLVVEFVGDSYRQASIGSGSPTTERWIETGAVMIYSVVQAGAGVLVARENAAAVAELLRGMILPGTIRIEAMSFGDSGPGDEDGSWWQLPLRVNWLRG